MTFPICYVWAILLWLVFPISMVTNISVTEPPEKKLRDDLLKSFSSKVRPVRKYEDRLDVNLRFKLIRVSDLDLKDQLLSLYVVIDCEWPAFKYKWNPTNYDGITELSLPSSEVWVPDIVPYNFLEFEFKSDFVIVDYTGLVKWSPILILKSFCLIEIRYYPFDIQHCNMSIGSWVYGDDKLYVTLKGAKTTKLGENSNLTVGMDLSGYTQSSDWDLLSIPGQVQNAYYYTRNVTATYQLIQFQLTLRRHSNFYLVNLVLPLIGLSYLSLLVFYLPVDSGEKITLCMSLVTSQIMFLLLMIDKIPVTSLAVPLLGKVIIFNMIFVFCSIFCTVIVLNVHYRKPSTHVLPNWVKGLSRNKFLTTLLFIHKMPNESNAGSTVSPLKMNGMTKGLVLTECNQSFRTLSKGFSVGNRDKLPVPIQRAIGKICYVRDHIQQEVETNKECQYWKFVAAVLDRIFFILFHVIYVIGILVIMWDAPALYDQTEPLGNTSHIY